MKWAQEANITVFNSKRREVIAANNLQSQGGIQEDKHQERQNAMQHTMIQQVMKTDQLNKANEI